MSYIDLLRQMMRRTGRIHLPALNDAMLPAIQSGDTLQVALPGDPATLEPGQIVVIVSTPSRYSIGRIATIEEGTVHLTSDNHPQSDVPVLLAQVLGRVTAVIRDGHFVEIADYTPFSSKARVRERLTNEFIHIC